MLHNRIDGFTRALGKGQGFVELFVRDDVVNERVCGVCAVMTTAWKPTPMELAALNAGASVHVRIVGTDHPPIWIETGPLPSERNVPPIPTDRG